MAAPDRAVADGWVLRLRESLNDDLVEVRYAPHGEGFDFLLIHGPDRMREAIGRFLDALGGPDMPPFDIRTAEAGAVLNFVELDDYVSV